MSRSKEQMDTNVDSLVSEFLKDVHVHLGIYLRYVYMYIANLNQMTNGRKLFEWLLLIVFVLKSSFTEANSWRKSIHWRTFEVSTPLLLVINIYILKVLRVACILLLSLKFLSLSNRNSHFVQQYLFISFQVVHKLPRARAYVIQVGYRFWWDEMSRFACHKSILRYKYIIMYRWK